MQSTPIVLEHAYKHGLSKRDIIHAWKNAYIERSRRGAYPPQHISIGPDRQGRDVELISVWNEELAAWVVFHAMKATPKLKREIGLM